jgi:hypothetical protein
MREMGFDYTTQMHVTAIDTDICCVHMSYVQMSLLGVPAVIFNGNTLSMEMNSVWYTPIHILGGWEYKLRPKEGEENATVGR